MIYLFLPLVQTHCIQLLLGAQVPVKHYVVLGGLFQNKSTHTQRKML